MKLKSHIALCKLLLAVFAGPIAIRPAHTVWMHDVHKVRSGGEAVLGKYVPECAVCHFDFWQALKPTGFLLAGALPPSPSTFVFFVIELISEPMRAGKKGRGPPYFFASD